MAIGVWCLIPNPFDLSPFDSERSFNELTACLRPWKDSGVIVVELSKAASESELRHAAAGKWSVLHFIGHAQERAAVGYSTLALLAGDGRARNLPASNFIRLVKDSSFRVILLEACDAASFCFDLFAQILAAELDVAVIQIPVLDGARRQNILDKIYSGLVRNVSGAMLAGELSNATGAAVRLISKYPDRAIFPDGMPEPPAQPPRAIVIPKPANETFDVFFSYHTADRPAVEKIAIRLKQAGVRPWLDAWELAPGRDWYDEVEEQISKVQSAAVFFGGSGRGPWQFREVRALLEQLVDRRIPIIPVLLEDAPLKPDLPLFLRALVWVDFRRQAPDPFLQLLWGITGKRADAE